MHNLKIGILRETKIPPDKRVALPPDKILDLERVYPQLRFTVQPCKIRCYTDEEYLAAGVEMNENLDDCDLLIGVKEVDADTLLPGKTYMFFAHVAKKQPYNQNLLQTILKRKINLIDYEYLTHENGLRLLAFGKWAGIVGAYNGLRGLGVASGEFDLKPAHQCHNLQDMNTQLNDVVLKNRRILVSGGGRVALGAMETLSRLNIRSVTPQAFLQDHFDEPVVCRIDPEHYVMRKDGTPFHLQHFFDHPSEYSSTAQPFIRRADLYIAAHFWDPKSPRMFELSDFTNTDRDRGKGFPIVIADISCDINGSIPTTTHPTTIENPFYWYGEEPRVLMMTVDNLPGELPRDASDDFSAVLSKEIIKRMVEGDPDGVIARATITENGQLTPPFSYLKEFSEGHQEQSDPT